MENKLGFFLDFIVMFFKNITIKWEKIGHLFSQGVASNPPLVGGKIGGMINEHREKVMTKYSARSSFLPLYPRLYTLPLVYGYLDTNEKGQPC